VHAQIRDPRGSADQLDTLVTNLLFSESATAETFDFHKYDALATKEQKDAAAIRDLNIVFPPGSAVHILEGYVSSHGGYCRERAYVPPVDRAVLMGDHIYCEVTYYDPSSNNPLIGVRWAIDIKFDRKTESIERLKVSWERYFVGG
jgi:hypothetical protein